MKEHKTNKDPKAFESKIFDIDWIFYFSIFILRWQHFRCRYRLRRTTRKFNFVFFPPKWKLREHLSQLSLASPRRCNNFIIYRESFFHFCMFIQAENVLFWKIAFESFFHIHCCALSWHCCGRKLHDSLEIMDFQFRIKLASRMTRLEISRLGNRLVRAMELNELLSTIIWWVMWVEDFFPLLLLLFLLISKVCEMGQRQKIFIFLPKPETLQDFPVQHKLLSSYLSDHTDIFQLPSRCRERIRISVSE